MSYFFIGFFGSIIIFFISSLSLRLTEVNISDAELYRFCMVQNIDLKDCKIPPMPLEVQK